MTSVVLVDDHPLVRQAVAAMIGAQDGLDVLAEAGSIAEARTSLNPLPDAAVIDVSLPDGSGLDLVREIRSRSTTIGLVVLTMHDDDDTVLSALDAGASGLVLKSAPSEEIVEAVRRAVAAPLNFSADALGRALRSARNRPATPVLTPRESEVLQHLADGLSVGSIARKLYLSESTVKTHITKIYDKLGARNRASAVMAAIKQGLVKAEQR
jgi:DNA-binding NarL/FixJ family response regulator